MHNPQFINCETIKWKTMFMECLLFLIGVISFENIWGFIQNNNKLILPLLVLGKADNDSIWF